MPEDPALPAAMTLLGDDAGPMLAAVVERSGGRMLAYRPVQASYRPGRKLLVHYECRVDCPADADAGGGQPVTWTLIARTVTGDAPQGTLVLERGSTRVALWRFPYDPYLPGLPSAMDPDRVREVLDIFGAGAGRPVLTVRSYRAERRAVVEARVDRRRLFLKVVRPAAGEALHRAQTAFAAQLPVPPALGWSPTLGIVALPAAPGRTLNEQLMLTEAPLPHPDSILSLCDRLAQVQLTTRAIGAVRSVERNARTVAALRPGLTDVLARIVAAVQTLPSEPTVTVHGDLHPAQLLTTDVVTGLLDVDRAGRGVQADDYAMLLAHLDQIARAQPPPARNRTETFATQLRALFETRVDPQELTLRTSAVLVGIATGPFRALDLKWPELTDRLVRRAESLLEPT
ncbi:phosphotransferase [Streptomyces flavidovirens]|uniref:phosphotransferase n=1 Tax=Streptomyces flavidovirens TaxID=67298 RepID=UPI003449C027